MFKQTQSLVESIAMLIVVIGLYIILTGIINLL